jgi:hypothetical protein
MPRFPLRKKRRRKPPSNAAEEKTSSAEEETSSAEEETSSAEEKTSPESYAQKLAFLRAQRAREETASRRALGLKQAETRLAQKLQQKDAGEKKQEPERCLVVTVVDEKEQKAEVLDAAKLKMRQAYAVALSTHHSPEEIEAKVAKGETNTEIEEWQAAQTLVRMRAFAKEFRPHVEREYSAQLSVFREAMGDPSVPLVERMKRLKTLEALVYGYLKTHFYQKRENSSLRTTQHELGLEEERKLRKRYTDLALAQLARMMCVPHESLLPQINETQHLLDVHPIAQFAKERVAREVEQQMDDDESRTANFILQFLIKLASFTAEQGVEFADAAFRAKLTVGVLDVVKSVGVAALAPVIAWCSTGAAAAGAAATWAIDVGLTNVHAWFKQMYAWEAEGNWWLALKLFGVTTRLFHLLIPYGKKVLGDMKSLKKFGQHTSAFVANLWQSYMCTCALTAWSVGKRLPILTSLNSGFVMAGVTQISVALFRTACQRIADWDANAISAARSASRIRLEGAQTAARQAMIEALRKKTDAVVSSEVDPWEKMQQLRRIEREEEEKSALRVARAAQHDPQSYSKYLKILSFAFNYGEFVGSRRNLGTNLKFALLNFIVADGLMFACRWGVTLKQEGEQGDTWTLFNGNIILGSEGEFPAYEFFEVLDHCDERDFLADLVMEPQMRAIMRAKCKLVAPYAQQLKNRAAIAGGGNAIGSAITAVAEVTSVANKATGTNSWKVGSLVVWGVGKLDDGWGRLTGWKRKGLLQAAINAPQLVEGVAQLEPLVGSNVIRLSTGELLNIPKHVTEAAAFLATQIVSGDTADDTIGDLMSLTDHFTLKNGLANRAVLGAMVQEGRWLTKRINDVFLEHKYALEFEAQNAAFRHKNDANPAPVSWLRHANFISPQETQTVWGALIQPTAEQLAETQRSNMLDRVESVQRGLNSADGAASLLEGAERVLANPATLTPPQARAAFKDMKDAVSLVEGIDGWQKEPLLVAQIARVRSLGRVRGGDGAPALTQKGLEETPEDQREAWVKEVADLDKRTRLLAVQGLAGMSTTHIKLLNNTDPAKLLDAGGEALNGFDNFVSDAQIKAHVPPQPFLPFLLGRLVEWAPNQVVYSGMLTAESAFVRARRTVIKTHLAELDPGRQFREAVATFWDNVAKSDAAIAKLSNAEDVLYANPPGEGTGGNLLIGTRADQAAQAARDAAQGKEPNFANQVVEDDGKPSDPTRDPTVVPSPETTGASEPFGALGALPLGALPADAAPGAVLPLRVHYRLAERDDDDDDTC